MIQDAQGNWHKSVGTTRDMRPKEYLLFEERPPFVEYEYIGDVHYLVDDKEVTEAEFKRMFPNEYVPRYGRQK